MAMEKFFTHYSDYIFIYLDNFNIPFLNYLLVMLGNYRKYPSTEKLITTTTTTTTNDNEIDHRNNYKVMGSPPDEYFNTVTLPYWKTNNDNNDNTKISKLANAYHSHGVQVKYCGTCHIWRPSRTSHCNTCQQCILNHDHHCIFK